MGVKNIKSLPSLLVGNIRLPQRPGAIGAIGVVILLHEIWASPIITISESVTRASALHFQQREPNVTILAMRAFVSQPYEPTVTTRV